MILLVRFTIMPLTSEQNEYAWCLDQPNLTYFLMCSMSKLILIRFVIKGNIIVMIDN